MSYISNKDFLIEVAKGNILGHSIVTKFGGNRAVPLTGADVWGHGGDYTFYPTAGQNMEAVSNDAGDADAGTGAWTIEIQGLDETWAEVTETITMNGTTAVPLANQYIRMYRIRVLTAGSTETNDGDIHVQIAGGGTIAASVEAGFGETMMALYTVPAGVTAHGLKHYCATADDDKNGQIAKFRIYARRNIEANGAWQTRFVSAVNSIGAGSWQYASGGPSGPHPGKTDLRLRCHEASAIMGVIGGFDLLLVEDGY